LCEKFLANLNEFLAINRDSARENRVVERGNALREIFAQSRRFYRLL
jgi:hypothetical protein